MKECDVMIYRNLLFIVCLMFFSSALPAGDLEGILDFHRQALGSGDAIYGLKTVIVDSRIELNGMPGKVITKISLPDKYVADFDLGFARQKSGFDGFEGWLMDANGQIRTESEAERRPAMTDIYFSSYAYLRDDVLPGEVILAGDTMISGLDYFHLKLYPPRGDSLSIYVNAETGLIDYRTGNLGGLQVETRYSDFRSVDGIMFPFGSHTRAINGPLDMTEEVYALQVNAEIPEADFARPGRGEQDFHFPNGVDSLVIPMNMAGGHVSLDVSVNGKGPYRFLLDSGAGTTFISEELGRELGLESQGEFPVVGGGGYNGMGLAAIDSLNIGQLSLYLERISLIDLSVLTSGGNKEPQGIVGYDFFARFPLRFDFAGEKMIVYKPEHDPFPDSGLTEGLEIYNQAIILEAAINGEPIRLMLDLGASVEIIIRSNARLYKGFWEGKTDEMETFSLTGVGGQHEVYLARIDSLTFAGQMERNATALLSPDYQSIPLPDYIEGILGIGILSDYEIFLDYATGRVAFFSQ